MQLIVGAVTGSALGLAALEVGRYAWEKHINKVPDPWGGLPKLWNRLFGGKLKVRLAQWAKLGTCAAALLWLAGVPLNVIVTTVLIMPFQFAAVRSSY